MTVHDAVEVLYAFLPLKLKQELFSHRACLRLSEHIEQNVHIFHLSFSHPIAHRLMLVVHE